MTVGGIPWVILYAANWARATGTQLGLFGHTWSLGIEEQFYLVWPVTLWLLVGGGLHYRHAVALSLVAIFGVALLRALMWASGAGIDRTYNGSDMRADALLVGCVVALLRHAGMRSRIPLGLVAAAIAFLAYTVVTVSPRSDFLYMGGLTAIAAAAAVIIIGLLQYPNPLTAYPLVWLGRISYGIYLWHYPIIVVLPLRWEISVRVTVAILTTLAAASLSWWLVERRFLAVKRPGSAMSSVRVPGA